MAEAVDGMRELGEHGRVEMDVGIAREMDVGRDLPGELLKHQMLVLRLGAEAGDLEDALAVPLVGGDEMGGPAG